MSRVVAEYTRWVIVASAFGACMLARSAFAVGVGDCDNNGMVAINEVQGCVNQFLATRPVQPCCDQGNNHIVEINEVQGAVNCFSGNPSPCPQLTPGPGGTPLGIRPFSIARPPSALYSTAFGGTLDVTTSGDTWL